MKIHHRDLVAELPDDWWVEAGMVGFSAAATHYACASPSELVHVDAIVPVRRIVGLFQTRERTVRVLEAIRQNVPLPPVSVHSIEISDAGGRRRLHHGVHRLYCSIACGFTHVPAYVVGDEFYHPPEDLTA